MAVRVSTGFASAILGPNSFDQIFRDGAIEIRAGAQPETADAPATGALLARITRNGGAWTPGSPANGLRFLRGGRYAIRDPSQIWVLHGLATGTAGWCRLVGNATDAGTLSLLLPRIDGAIALLPPDEAPPAGDFQLVLPTLAMTPGTTIPINQWYYAIPPIGA